MSKKIELELQVTQILHKLGVPARLNGYCYLRDSIILLVEDMETARAITGVLYPNVARINNSTAERVERAVRTAISSSWKNGDINAFEEIFGYSRENHEKKPCNSEYMVQIADWIQLDRRKNL